MTQREYYNTLPDCSVCYEKMGRNKITLPCNHSFHEKCLSKWVEEGNNTCPMCRFEFFEIVFNDPNTPNTPNVSNTNNLPFYVFGGFTLVYGLLLSVMVYEIYRTR